MRNWLYSLTPATRGIVILAGSLFAVAACTVLWSIAEGGWMLIVILALWVLAMIGFSWGATWLGLARTLDPHADPESTTRAAPLGPTRPAAEPAAPRQFATDAVTRLRSEQSVLRRWIVGDAIVMALLVVGFLIDYWLQGPIGLAVTFVFGFLGAAALGLALVVAAVVDRRLLRRREEELSRVARSPRAVGGR